MINFTSTTNSLYQSFKCIPKNYELKSAYISLKYVTLLARKIMFKTGHTKNVIPALILKSIQYVADKYKCHCHLISTNYIHLIRRISKKCTVFLCNLQVPVERNCVLAPCNIVTTPVCTRR